MAIGARITSTNLSGKTATVLFTPYTGLTSGTTLNLGEQTIPFNNINSHPYGDYAIYLPEYDYTYTLNIPEPLSNPQRFFVVDRMVSSDNYGLGVLNFDDFTAEIIDLGVDATYWDNNDIYPLQDSGCMHVFQGDSNYNEKLIIFTNVDGIEIGRYSGVTESYNEDSLMGKWVTYEDEDNGVLTYSDGTSVYTYSWDPVTHFIDIEWDWDSTTSDGTFIIKKWENGSWNYNGNGQSYLVNPTDGTTSLFKTWSDGTLVDHQIAISANFIVVETRDQSTNTHTSLEIYDLTGTILETISLSGVSYTNRNRDFIGTNMYNIVYYNDGDNSIDYKIVHYNSNTSTLTQTSHVRGTNYPGCDVYSDNNFYPERSEVNGGIVMMFFNSLNYTNYGMEVNYCDFVYMLPTQTEFTGFEFTNNATAYINSWGQLSDFYRTFCSSGNGYLEFLTISLSGGSITTSQISVSDVTGVNQNHLTNKTLFLVLTNSANTINMILVNESGTIEDALSMDLSVSWGYNSTTVGGVGYMSIQGASGNIGYYVYSGTTEFIQTDYYQQINDSNIFENNETYLEPVVFVLYNDNNQNFRVLTATGITNELNFPESWNNHDIIIGKNKFMLVYSSDSDNLTKIKLYDFSGQTLNSYTTTYDNGWNNVYGVKDRFVVQLYAEGIGTNEYFLISENINTSITLQNYDMERTTNDFLYWWD